MKQSLNLFKKTRLFESRFNKLFKTQAFNFAEKMKIRKDYYEILGIPKNASEEQIKQSYRNLAKKYHPDVNIGGEDKYQPSTQKFREIAEAYAVLSNKIMKIDYDTRLRNFPDSDLSLDNLKKNLDKNQKERDTSGNSPNAGPLKGTYADYRGEKLKEWRKMFNVDDHGFFKGGVPRQGKGNTRGNAMGPAGMYNDPYGFNTIVHDQPAVKIQVDNVEAKIHKEFMNFKREEYKRFKPYFNMDKIQDGDQYEMDSETRWLFIIPVGILTLYSLYYVKKRIENKMRIKSMNDHVKKMEAYDFGRIGPFLVEEQFMKFSSKFLSREDYHRWIDNDLRTFK